MRNILVYIESRYPISKKTLVGLADNFLDKEKIKGSVEVSIAVVGDRKMRELNKKYRQLDETTSVLSFSLSGFVTPNDEILRLGDVVISYPQAVERAMEDEVLVDDKLKELLIHGLNNLLGKEEGEKL